jgi:putative transposase
MKLIKAHKFELIPSGEQLRDMRSFVGLARKIWNLALAKQEADYANGAKYSNAISMNYWIADWKPSSRI